MKKILSLVTAGIITFSGMLGGASLYASSVTYTSSEDFIIVDESLSTAEEVVFGFDTIMFAEIIGPMHVPNVPTAELVDSTITDWTIYADNRSEVICSNELQCTEDITSGTETFYVQYDADVKYSVTYPYEDVDTVSVTDAEFEFTITENVDDDYNNNPNPGNGVPGSDDGYGNEAPETEEPVDPGYGNEAPETCPECPDCECDCSEECSNDCSEECMDEVSSSDSSDVEFKDTSSRSLISVLTFWN